MRFETEEAAERRFVHAYGFSVLVTLLIENLTQFYIGQIYRIDCWNY